MAYYIIKDIVNHEFNEKLYADRDQFLYEWHTYDDIQEVFYLNIGDQIKIDLLAGNQEETSYMRDTLMWDDYEKRILPFRQLYFTDKLNGQNYSITITKSLLPSEDLIRGMSEIILFLMISVILSLLVVNRQISKIIWAPFYDTITKLKRFKIAAPAEVSFEPTRIFEFEQLNGEIKAMLDKSRADYINLKEFAENASHEIQTPLAIIKSKTEMLLQHAKWPEEGLVDINKINEAANRLSKLNTDLILLTQIDNHQYQELERIDLVRFIDKKLTYFEELIELKTIKLHKKYHARPELQMNNSLAFVLINNLLKNAIKHNINDGYLTITVFYNKMTFENSGMPLKTKPESMFQRFKKGNTSIESSGLGLALIKKVCDIYQMKISYAQHGTNHKIEVQF